MTTRSWQEPKTGADARTWVDELRQEGNEEHHALRIERRDKVCVGKQSDDQDGFLSGYRYLILDRSSSFSEDCRMILWAEGIHRVLSERSESVCRVICQPYITRRVGSG